MDAQASEDTRREAEMRASAAAADDQHAKATAAAAAARALHAKVVERDEVMKEREAKLATATAAAAAERGVLKQWEEELRRKTTLVEEYLRQSESNSASIVLARAPKATTATVPMS
jgi:hypothetical protein